jgi:hypothetical protein
MDIEWFRDLSITVMGFAAAISAIIVTIVLLRLQRTTNGVLKELKAASMLARDTAEILHEGVQPVASISGFFRAMKQGADQSTADRKRRR